MYACMENNNPDFMNIIFMKKKGKKSISYSGKPLEFVMCNTEKDQHCPLLNIVLLLLNYILTWRYITLSFHLIKQIKHTVIIRVYSYSSIVLYTRHKSRHAGLWELKDKLIIYVLYKFWYDTLVLDPNTC